jgi:hypothetical protein
VNNSLCWILLTFLTGCSNALYFYETEKISLTAEARPDSSQPVQGSLGIKQRVVLIAPKGRNNDAVSSISSFSFNIFPKSGTPFNPVLNKTAFITGDAAARLNTPQTAGAAALAISLDGIKTTGTDETTSETVKSILSDLKNDADRNILKTITAKDFGTLSDQDYENILRITGMDKMNYSIELHKALHKELIN